MIRLESYVECIKLFAFINIWETNRVYGAPRKLQSFLSFGRVTSSDQTNFYAHYSKRISSRYSGFREKERSYLLVFISFPKNLECRKIYAYFFVPRLSCDDLQLYEFEFLFTCLIRSLFVMNFDHTTSNCKTTADSDEALTHEVRHRSIASRPENWFVRWDLGWSMLPGLHESSVITIGRKLSWRGRGTLSSFENLCTGNFLYIWCRLNY